VIDLERSFIGVDMSKTFEMMWDCSYCDTKKLLGKSHKHCPNCGTAQDPTQRYFPPDEEKIAVEDHEYVGRDIICGFCDAPNSALAKFCTECAGPMDGTKTVQLINEGGEITNQTPKPKQTKNSAIQWFFGIIAFGVIILLVLSLEEEKKVTVSGHSWSRSIEVEKYKLVTKENWQDRVPTNGKIQSCKNKKRDTKKIEDGEECSTIKKDNGDGTYNESETCETKYKTVPIYDDWCKYEIKKWTVVRTETETGNDLQPSWPTVSMRTCDMVALNCEREGKRKSVYSVLLKDEKNKIHDCSFEENKWKEIQEGNSKTMSFGSVTGLIDCDSWDAE